MVDTVLLSLKHIHSKDILNEYMEYSKCCIIIQLIIQVFKKNAILSIINNS